MPQSLPEAKSQTPYVDKGQCLKFYYKNAIGSNTTKYFKKFQIKHFFSKILTNPYRAVVIKTKRDSDIDGGLTGLTYATHKSAAPDQEMVPS